MENQSVAYSRNMPVTVVKQSVDSFVLRHRQCCHYLPLCSAGEECVCAARTGVEVLTPCFCLLSGVAASCGGSPVLVGLSPFASEFPVMESWGSSSPEWTDDDDDNDNGLLIFLFSCVSDVRLGVSDSGLLLLAFRSPESLWFETSSAAITSVAMIDDGWCVINYNRSAKGARKTILCTKNKPWYSNNNDFT